MGRWARITVFATCIALVAAEQCSEGQQEPLPGDCSRFKSCRTGQWREMSCFPPLQVYDPRAGKCVSDDVYPCPQCYPEGKSRPNNCTSYEVCKNGSWSTQRCPSGYAYDNLTSSCVKKEMADCFGCAEGHSDPNDCNSYFTCEGVQRVKKTCGWFQKYDGVSRKCVWFGAECRPRGTCAEENIKYPTENCNEYNKCISGMLYKKSCGFSQIFDSMKGTCVWVWPWDTCEMNLSARCLDGQTKVLGCRLHSECMSGVWHQKQCNEGETFKGGRCIEGPCEFSAQHCDEYTVNGESVKCESGYYFNEMLSRCVPGLCDSKPGDSRQADTNAACKEGEAKRVKETCKKYKVCRKGNWLDEECARCQNFDDRNSRCMFVWDSPCTNGSVPTPNPSSTSTSTAPPTSPPSSPSTSPTTTTPRPCKKGERKPDYESCRKYYECDGKATWHHKSCAWYFFYKFDEITLKCKFWSAHCATPSL